MRSLEPHRLVQLRVIPRQNVLVGRQVGRGLPLGLVNPTLEFLSLHRGWASLTVTENKQITRTNRVVWRQIIK